MCCDNCRHLNGIKHQAMLTVNKARDGDVVGDSDSVDDNDGGGGGSTYFDHPHSENALGSCLRK